MIHENTALDALLRVHVYETERDESLVSCLGCFYSFIIATRLHILGGVIIMLSPLVYVISKLYVMFTNHLKISLTIPCIACK